MSENNEEVELYIEGAGNDICSPFINKETGKLNWVSESTGDIITYSDEEGDFITLGSSRGQPSSCIMQDDLMFVADFAHAAVITIDEEGKQQIVSRVYEDRPFKGPSGLAFDSDGVLYFTDSGPFGETGIQNPYGSVYAVVSGHNGQMLKPLAFECLAYPSDIAVSNDDSSIFVTEMMTNRLLRFVQRPTGVYHMSVFAQLSGGMGPSCVTCSSSGKIFLGHFDFATIASEGLISVFSSDGDLEATYTIPASEITGIVLSKDEKTLYITESSTSSIYSINVSSLK